MTYGGGAPGFKGATFVSGDITFQEDTFTSTEIDSSAYLDLPTGETALYHALMKAEDNDVQGWIWGAHVAGLFPGWWAHTYGGDLSVDYDARLNALIQRAALIVHLAREQNGVLRLNVLQSRTRPAPANAVRFDLVPGQGMVALKETTTETVNLVGRIPGLVEITRLS